MTKTKELRKRQEAESRLKARISFCQKRGDFIGVVKAQKELNALNELHLEEIRTALSVSMKDHSEEEKREATTRLIYAMAIGDLLGSAIGDVESYMRLKFGIDNISVLDQMRQAVKILQGVVRTIDECDNALFSDNYMEIVDEIEMQWGAALKTAALNKLLKASKAKDGGWG